MRWCGVSKTLAAHRTMAELFKVLGEHLHPLVPFDYLALLLHDQPRAELRLVVLEPSDFVVPFVSKPVAEHGPAATVWETQRGAVIPIPPAGPLPEVLELIRSQGYRMTCWLPLTTAHRRVGVLAFGSRSDSAYTEDVLAFMEQVAAVRRHRRRERDQLGRGAAVRARASRGTGWPAVPARRQ